MVSPADTKPICVMSSRWNILHRMPLFRFLHWHFNHSVKINAVALSIYGKSQPFFRCKYSCLMHIIVVCFLFFKFHAAYLQMSRWTAYGKYLHFLILNYEFVVVQVIQWHLRAIEKVNINRMPITIDLARQRTSNINRLWWNAICGVVMAFSGGSWKRNFSSI